MFVGRTLIPAPHGQLEAIYKPSSEASARVSLVLHPHPLYGGTMHNKVVAHTAKALEAAGFETLRFNFRGVGASTGAHDHGRGAEDDARVALDWLLERQRAARQVLVAGFSFGAAVGLRFGCAEPRAHRLLAIGTPARGLDAERLARCGKPIDFVHGERDEVAPLAPLRALVVQLDATHVRLRVIADTGHFFESHLDALRAAVTELVAVRATPS